MPYKNIVYAKLEKRLLNDPRWFSMPDSCQLLYIKLILAACETYNRVPKRCQNVRTLCRVRTRAGRLSEHIEIIKKHFPKFKENTEHYYFEDFEEKTNYIQGNPLEIPRKSEGLPKVDVDKENSIVDKEKKKISLPTNKFLPPTIEQVSEYCLERKNGIDPKYFIDKNQAVDWVDKNGNKYKDWKAVIRQWEKWSKKSDKPTWENEAETRKL